MAKTKLHVLMAHVAQRYYSQREWFDDVVKQLSADLQELSCSVQDRTKRVIQKAPDSNGR